jgi:hypothetical protein
LARAEDAPTAPLEAKLVEEVFVRVAPVLHLHVGGQVIRTTAEHPFFAYNKGWITAGELRVGDRLLGRDGEWTAVEDLLDTGASERVYNLRVQDYQTYFVGSEEWGFSVWAHNSDGCVHRVGGGDEKNLGLKPHEAKLDPPGISVLIGGTPADTAAAFRRVFGPKSSLGKAARNVGTAESEQIRAAGFDVVPVPTSNFPNHGRIIHPTEGAAGFTPENLQRLSQVFSNTTGL